MMCTGVSEAGLSPSGRQAVPVDLGNPNRSLALASWLPARTCMAMVVTQPGFGYISALSHVLWHSWYPLIQEDSSKWMPE